MGLAKSTVGYLVRHHKNSPLQGPILILGRQHVFATLEEVRAMMRSQGLDPHPLPEGMSELSDMPSWEYGLRSRFTSDTALIWTLTGERPMHLDSSDYEDAEIIWDLNRAVPEELRRRYGTVIDAGTIEHVFDIRSSLQNVNALLKPEGQAMHITQCSNWHSHGFYQFCPTLFFDYYSANGFRDFDCYLADQGSCHTTRAKWNWYRWDLRSGSPNIKTDHYLGLLFSARKQELSTEDMVPQQGHYLGSWQFGVPAGPPLHVRLMPAFLKDMLRKAYWMVKKTNRF